MTTMSRRLDRPTLLSAVLLAALVLALVAAGLVLGLPRAQASTPGVHRDAAPAANSLYVALGDSYAAGYGIGTSTDKPVPGCAQSTQDYPHQIAAALKLRLADRTCSGAEAGNIDSYAQQTSDGLNPRQDLALNDRAKLVTLTIGGNDLGFSDIAQYCLAQSATGPLFLHPEFTNCRAHYAPQGGVDTLAQRITNVVAPRLARVLADVKTRAPNAAIYVIDYPAISTTKAAAPDPSTFAAGCYSSPLGANSFPFTAIDTVYLQGIEARLNSIVLQQAKAAGVHFVQAYPQSLTHSACTGTADPWMNGVTLDFQTGGAAPGSLHPNLEGATQLAGDALAAIGPQN